MCILAGAMAIYVTCGESLSIERKDARYRQGGNRNQEGDYLTGFAVKAFVRCMVPDAVGLLLTSCREGRRSGGGNLVPCATIAGSRLRAEDTRTPSIGGHDRTSE